MLPRKYAQGTLIKEKWLQDWYCTRKSSGCSLFFDSSLVLLFFAAAPADVPADTSCTSCLPPLSRYASGEGRNWAGRAGHFLIVRVSPGPSVSVLFWFMLSSPYLFSALSSRGPGETSLSWIFGAGLRALTCCKHAPALTRLVSLPPSLSPKMDCQSGGETENCWNIYTSDHYEVCHVITHARIILAPICSRAGTDRLAPCVGAHVSRCLHTTCVCVAACFCGWIRVCVC